jgi:Xaa-Pro aminopeptidase
MPGIFRQRKIIFFHSEIRVLPYPKTKKEWELFFLDRKVQVIGIEFSRVSTKTFFDWKNAFSGECIDVSTDIDRIRSQKHEAEIAAAQKASSLLDEAMKRSLPFLQSGVSEKEFAWILEKAGRELGAEKISFEPIVAFGEHSAIPHHSPTEKELKKEMPILIDWGFVSGGFCSDCTRCFWYGENPDPKWIDAYQRVSASQQKGMDIMTPNKEISAVQKAAEEVLGENIPHSFGHGVGLEVHEYPTISPKSKGVFWKNMIVTAEPGMYFSGKFGIRIEDMGVIESSGFLSLTGFPKGLEHAILSDFGHLPLSS